jgi:4'-phosphopantetheinyl transferase
MSVVFIKSVDENAQLGLWRIEEAMDELLAGLILNSMDEVIFNSKNSTAKKKEWLAIRNLLNVMMPENMGIGYDNNGKPYLRHSSCDISITHSGEYACVYLNKQNPVGVDIQKLKPDISKGANFFLSQTEIDYFGTDDNVLLHILWSAKEAVYKFFGSPDMDLKKDIYLLPFQSRPYGKVEVRISQSGRAETIFLHYQMIDNYVLTRTN